MTDWAQRLTDEYMQLTERFEKLQSFMATDEFRHHLNAAERVDLQQQHLHMGQYRDVLLRRMARIPPEDN